MTLKFSSWSSARDDLKYREIAATFRHVLSRSLLPKTIHPVNVQTSRNDSPVARQKQRQREGNGRETQSPTQFLKGLSGPPSGQSVAVERTPLLRRVSWSALRFYGFAPATLRYCCNKTRLYILPVPQFLTELYHYRTNNVAAISAQLLPWSIESRWIVPREISSGR